MAWLDKTLQSIGMASV